MFINELPVLIAAMCVFDVHCSLPRAWSRCMRSGVAIELGSQSSLFSTGASQVVQKLAHLLKGTRSPPLAPQFGQTPTGSASTGAA